MNVLHKFRVLKYILLFVSLFCGLSSWAQTVKLSSLTYASSPLIENYDPAQSSAANRKSYTTSMKLSGQITFDRVLTPNMNRVSVNVASYSLFDGLNTFNETNSYVVGPSGQPDVSTNANGDITSINIIFKQWQNPSKFSVNDFINEIWITSNYTSVINGGYCGTPYNNGYCSHTFYDRTNSSIVIPLPAITYLSANANLSGLLISSNGQSSSPPNFSPSSTNYSVSVPYAMATMTVTPTLESGSATISVNGKTASNNTASSSIVLNQGSNTVSIVVTAQDGTKKTYTLTVTRLAPSTNANLTDISLNNNASISPTFAATTTAYTASVPYLTTTIKLTPTSAETTAAISVNGKSTASGSASSDVVLNVGSNVINAVATAEDGISKKTYSVTVTRQAPSANADLSSLSLSNNASINPGFVSNTTSYTSTVPYSRSTLTITPTLADGTASILVNGKAVSDGYPSQTIYLSVGSNTINVTTTAQNGTTKKSYTVVVTRTQPATDANLSGLSLNNGALLSPTFATNTTSYTSTVLYAVSAIKTTPILSDANASVFVNGKLVTNATASSDILLNVGTNTINVVVTAEDLITRRAYTAVITRLPASTNADVNSISLNNGATISPSFATSTYAYTSTVAYAVKALKFTSSSADATATITVNGKAIPSGVASSDVLLSVGSNTINVVSTAQDGVTKKTYTFVITRNPASTNADLTSITLNNGVSLNPSFATNTNSYTSTVLYAVSAVKFTSLVADPTAIITVNGKIVASGAASSDVLLNVGANTINVISTAEDGVTKKTYSIVITRSPASTNADLTNLSMNNGASLSPAFGTNTTSYTSAVAYAVSSLKFTSTLSDATAIITVNGKTVANGTASSDVLLNVGNNTITVLVTAQNGTTKKTYTIVVTRAAASTTATMGGLSIDQGTLSPSFGANTFAYTTTVANAVNSITLTPTITSSLATLKVNGITATSGQASTISLGFGSTTITMVVTAEDKTTLKTYTLTVNRALSANADLSNLSITGGSLSPTFSSASTTYTATVPYASTSTTVTPVKSQANATVKVNTTAVTASKLINLTVGANTITTQVTAQDGVTTKTYTLTVTRAAASANANLSTVALSSGTVSITAATTYNGIISTKPTITITPTAADASSVIKVNGKVVANGAASGLVPLTNGVEVPIQITLLAQDGTTSKTYSLGVTYTPPSCAPVNLGTTNANGKTYRVLKFSTVGECEWTAPTGVTKIDYLVVAGGGGTSGSTATNGFGEFIGGGGGGGGGVLTASNYSITPGQTYNVKVGSGGLGGLKSDTYSVRAAKQGGHSQFGSIMAYGGGYGGGKNEYGGPGGSGGGGGGYGWSFWPNNGGLNTIGQGYVGGASAYSLLGDALDNDRAGGGGGGGAAAAGANSSGPRNGGNGGAGLLSTITGANVYYGGGGGGGTRDMSWFFGLYDESVSPGSGGTGGGAAGNRNGNGNDGTDGLGGGAGGVGGDGNGGAGGDGVVIIRYEELPNVPVETTIVGTVTTTNNVSTFTADPSGAVYKVLTFSTLGNYPDWVAPAGVTSVDYLVVGGGGSGGTPGGNIGENYWGTGGGGAGGLLQGIMSVTSGGTYSVTVGGGGTAPVYTNTNTYVGVNGNNSLFGGIEALGGGGGGAGVNVASGKGNDGGSGGGSGGDNGSVYALGTSGQGFNGMVSRVSATNRTAGGGGGGAGGLGTRGGHPDGNNSVGGNGGPGIASTITGTSLYYAGGGGGGARDTYGGQGGGTGGSGVGGNGSINSPSNGMDGRGAGGGGTGADAAGGNGGSGVVILRYAVSTDANLTALGISSGTLSPVFASSTLAYTVQVPNTVSTFAITPTLSYGEALVSINGEAAQSGQPSRAFDLLVGENSFSVIVTAADKRTKKTYTIEVHRISADATLADLSLTEGSLTPTFDPAAGTYTALVSSSVTSLKVIPTLTDATASVKVNGVTVANKQQSGSINLGIGPNDITLVATAEDGTTTKTYTVTVTRVSVDLSALSVGSGTLSQTFSPNLTTYTSVLANAITSTTILPTAVDANSTVKVNSLLTTSGQESSPLALKVGDNTVDIDVIAQDGSLQKRYTITLTRTGPSTIASLSNIALSNGTLSPVFSSGTSNYTASVPNSVSSMTMTSTVTEANATITINGDPVASGQSSGLINLGVGANVITVEGTAQDGVTKQLYTITVTRAAPSAIATLANLALSNGTISPVFASGTTNYTASVANNISAITLTPTVTDATATVSVNGDLVANGQSSSQINVGVGDNVITIVGTAQDGLAQQTYTLTVTRAAPSAVATLANLVLSNGTISPVFSSNTTSYTTTVANSVSSITLTPTLTDETAVVSINGDLIASGQSMTSINLGVGANVITVVGLAQDGNTQQIYSVTVNRTAPSNMASLSGLLISKGTLSPAFSSGTTNYSATVATNVNSLTLTPTLSNSLGTVTVNGDPIINGQTTGQINLDFGANVISVIGTAQDGSTQQSYTLTITRTAPSTDATLQGLALSEGILSPGFTSGTTSYATTVANSVSSITLTPTVTDAGATITVNGDPVISGRSSGIINLSVGSNVITVMGTAQDGNTLQSYSVTVTRTAPSTIATLSSLSLSAGLLNPTFSSGTSSYSVNVANSVSAITLLPTCTDAGASLTVNGNTVVSGQSTSPINLSVGTNTLTVVVTAQDGSTQQIYTIMVTRTAPSTIATLSNVALSNGLLNSNFASGITSYSATVGTNVSSLTLTPTLTDVNATVSVNGDQVLSGQSSGAINLGFGSNQMTLIGLAQDGVTQQSYTITVTRTAPSSVATLSALTISNGTLNPTFSSNTTSYAATVANSISSITLTPIVSDANATISVNGNLVTSGQTSGAINLSPGENTISVLVRAEDQISSKTYVLTVTRTATQLSISAPIIMLTKPYDGNELAAITAGNLIGVQSGDDVVVTATAKYINSEVGTGKIVMVTYALSGLDASKYVRPNNEIFDSGIITNINPTISGFASISKTVGDAAFTLTAPTSNSTGAFTYTSSNTAVATINGSVVTIVGAGTATITATQAADINYSSGTIATRITVSAATNSSTSTNTTTPPLDTDGDGVSDAQEAIDGTDPNSATSFKDTDGDGIPDEVEVIQGTSTTNASDSKDSDGDGVPDYIEVKQGTNPNVAGDAKDSDGDGIPDYIEVKQGTNPTVAGDAKDSDGDGVPDYIEVQQGTNPAVAYDAKDTDGDGIPDFVEIAAGLDPNDATSAIDSDGDGVPDYVEIKQGTNPKDAKSVKDSDGDGVPDYIEIYQGTNPNSALSFADADGDGISDVEEGYSRLKGAVIPDLDGDGIPDYRDTDCDGDGILDVNEDNLNLGALPDCDGDGIANRLDKDVCVTFTPQGISPNGDGENDVLLVPGVMSTQPNKLIVYNRTGIVVYEQVNYQNDWGGRDQTGNLLPDGVYYYVVDFNGVKPTVSTFIYISRLAQ